MTEEETNTPDAPEEAAPAETAPAEAAPAAEGMNVPDGVLYADTDEWIKIEGNIATIGITDYAQHQLGDIVAIDLPEAGMEISKGDSVGVIESVKAAADFYAPISGKVTEANSELTGDAPNLDSIKNDAYSVWLIKVELSDPAEEDILMSAEAYKSKIKG